MTDATLDLPDITENARAPSLRRQIRRGAQTWIARHLISLVILLALLALVGAVHGIGMSTFPGYVDDPGTYLSQAWSLQYEHRLSPYSYFYDHAPAGWIQIAAWSGLTNGFDRYDSAIAFGNECMLIAKLVSMALLFVLGRRLGFGRIAATGAALLFGLCPLELVYGRWTFLDNLVTPWLLLAFVLTYSPRRSIGAAVGAAMAFGMAALTKETALVLLPAFGWAVLQNLDRRNRPQVLVTSVFAGAFLMGLYPLFALLKGELLPGPGHNSLIGTAIWQLAGRAASGSVLDPDSATADQLHGWLQYDRWLLLLGLAAIPVALLVRRLRPVALVLIIQWLVMVRGGYVPFMHVINLLPWSALLVAGAVSTIAGNPTLVPPGWLRAASGAAHRARVGVAVLLTLGLVTVTTVSWAPRLRPMMTVTQEQPLHSATTWLADNVPRNKVIVVHDSIWTDLVHRYGFNPRPIMIYKLDSDPAVRDNLGRVDYLVVPDWYYRTGDAAQKYPTLVEARKHAVAVATFGAGTDRVQIYRVSDHWKPPT
ncbi:glycosyltransferase family 39 protein [Kribbella sp. VKM Ac-2568]|uniref:glycosyltransferase family 39 protein n=1 Tax=Kribbella sp. VKM Ac-2568 TaxID=2512219 RepID=UPI00104BA0AE|nr:glycosyltransferase family 39 protein [Kribbella sp. VKM Ac-2568]TCM38516.1 4-amino-4-deoxy-L-arabinose transferase-like glycosyltransferase [Kribbella sp. VKM Ac-2568]